MNRIKRKVLEDFSIIGIDDQQFGQRLKAFVLPVKNSDLTEEEILEWLRSRVARFQLSKEIEFVDHLPYTVLGKPDKKRLI